MALNVAGSKTLCNVNLAFICVVFAIRIKKACVTNVRLVWSVYARSHPGISKVVSMWKVMFSQMKMSRALNLLYVIYLRYRTIKGKTLLAQLHCNHKQLICIFIKCLNHLFLKSRRGTSTIFRPSQC